MNACDACGYYPCTGTHMHCQLDAYAAHRGLSIDQLIHQQRFAERRAKADRDRWVRAQIERIAGSLPR